MRQHLKISISQYLHTNILSSTTEYLERMDTVVRPQDSGLLEVTVTSVLPRDTFTAEVVIACDVTIPNTGDTPHLVREELHPYQTSSKLNMLCTKKVNHKSSFPFEFEYSVGPSHGVIQLN